MATVADFYEALNHYVADAEKLRLIVQGDETTVVSTMFGPIDSVAKTIAEIEAEINAAGTGWLALAEAAADDAQSSANDAVSAAMASGIDAFANTYADAQTASGSLQVGDSIMIFTDENASDSLTVRLVESGGTLSVVKANFTAPSPLLSSTAPGEGASLVKYENGLTVEQAFPTVQVPDLYTLANSPWLQVDGLQVEVGGFYATGDGGNKRVYWDASRNKADADGGAVTDPTALGGWDGTAANLDDSTYYNPTTGQGSGTGTGCWVMTDTAYNLAQWGFSVNAPYRGNRFALEHASNFAFSIGGATLIVDPGVYLIRGAQKVGALRGGTYLRGTPRGTIFKKPDAEPGETDADLKFIKMLRWDFTGASDYEVSLGVGVYGIDFDGNQANQNWSGGYSQGQAKNLQVRSQNANVQCPFVVENVRQYDSVSDGISINRFIDAHLTNVRGHNCFRGVITVTGVGTNISMDDIYADGSGLTFEIEPLPTNPRPLNIKGSNITCEGEFDLLLDYGSTCDLTNLDALNVNVNGDGASNFTFTGGRLTTNENAGTWTHPGQIRFNGTQFIAKRSASATGNVTITTINPDWSTSAQIRTGQRIILNDCTWVAEVDAGDTVRAINGQAPTNAEDNKLIVNGGSCTSDFDDFMYFVRGGVCQIGGDLYCDAKRFLRLQPKDRKSTRLNS